ncbi:CNN1 protein, partial [Crotophaga sulcirostris]|nr:CNN1 protein [Crotophaga sulcirostris]
LAQKYDPQRERELRTWIEGTTGRRIGDNFMDGLKDGVILCELINKLQPGSVQKVNEPTQNWHKLENIGNFLRAITRYGVKPHDIFEANDLFENTNHTQVQSTLIALASQVTPQGATGSYTGPRGTPREKRALPDPCSRTGPPAPRGEGCPPALPLPQAGMTAPGTKRQIFEPALGMEHCDTMTIGLQMGSNKGASQQGMTVYGLPRQVYDPKYC